MGTDKLIGSIGALCWEELEARESIANRPTRPSFAKALLSIADNSKIPAVVLLAFCLEGDNLTDAIRVATHANQLLKFQPAEAPWKMPPSWVGLFGRGPDKSLY